VNCPILLLRHWSDRNLWLYGFDREVIEVTSELVRVRMAFAEGPTRFNGTLGGGAIMTLAGIWPHGKLVNTPPQKTAGARGADSGERESQRPVVPVWSQSDTSRR
jgi:hypothetical protein